MVAGVCLLVLSVIEKEKMGQKTTIVLSTFVVKVQR